MTDLGRSFVTVPRSGEHPLDALRRRCAAAERAAAELADEVHRLASEMTEFAERPITAAKAVSVEGAAQLLGISRTSLYELIESGAIRSVKVGSRRLVPMVALDEFLAGDSHSETG